MTDRSAGRPRGVAPVGGLVGELAAQLAEGGVGQGPAELALLGDHAFDVEVLDGDDVVGAGQGGRDEVEVQGPGLGDPAVEPAPAADKLAVVLRPPLGPGDGPVEAPEAPQVDAEDIRVGDVAGAVGEAGNGFGCCDPGVSPRRLRQ